MFHHWLTKAFPNPVMLDEFSNARGALKFMRNVAAGRVKSKGGKATPKQLEDV